MEALIKSYTDQYNALRKRIKNLTLKLLTQKLKTMQRERLKARIRLLKEEEYDVLCAINDLQKHL